MRKKSPATIQKWVDSISEVDSESKECNKIEEETSNCDINEASTSASGENLKVKLNEICNKISAKGKKIEFKNLLKLKRENSMEQTNDSDQENSGEIAESLGVKSNENLEYSQEISAPPEPIINFEDPLPHHQENDENHPPNDKSNSLRCPLSVLGRSSSENPPRNRRLNDIGRSFSVSHENELETNSTENLIYDADEDISITIPSLNTSSSIVSNENTNQSLSNSQLVPGRPTMRPAREHTVSEGHQSPQIQPRNPLLRDSSFQSDSSHCSSVESLLEARKPDAEAILINLGFGPARGSDDVVSKIPKRFLKPSQVKGVDTDAFLRNQHLSMHIHENSVLGYRGLLGNHHVPSNVVKAIIDRFSANEIQRMESEDYYRPKSFKGVAHTILAHRQFMK